MRVMQTLCVKHGCCLITLLLSMANCLEFADNLGLHPPILFHLQTVAIAQHDGLCISMFHVECCAWSIELQIPLHLHQHL